MFHIIIELIYFNDFVRFWVLFWGSLLSLGVEITETAFWNLLKITKGRKDWKILFSSLTFSSFCVKRWNLTVQTTDSKVFLFGCHCWYLGWSQGLLKDAQKQVQSEGSILVWFCWSSVSVLPCTNPRCSPKVKNLIQKGVELCCLI